MDELLAKLALLNKEALAAEAALNAAKNAEEKKKAIEDINKAVEAITTVNIEIADKKAEDLTLAQLAGLKKVNARQTGKDGPLKASDISTHDNIYDDSKLGFKHFGDVAMSVYNFAMDPTNRDPRLDVIASGNPELQAAGLRQGNGPDGGFLVPPGVRSADLSNEQGTSLDLYGQTRNFQLGQEDAIEIPAINETSRKDGSMYGGVTANWLEEEEEVPESEPKFRQIALKPKEIAVLIKVSNRLLRNSPIALGQFLDFASRDVMTFKLSDAVINGDGAGKPIGILQSDALVSVAEESGQTADTVVVENTLKMKAKMTRRWMNGAVWLINKDVMPQIELFKIGDQPVFAPANNVAGRPFDTLHNIRIQETEYNPVLGDQGDIILTNLMAYVTAQHGGGILADTSTHFLFDTNKTVFKFIGDADGQTWLKSPITDFQGSGTTSPFVTLDERA